MKTIDNKAQIVNQALTFLSRKLKYDETRIKVEYTLRQYGVSTYDKDGNDRSILDILSETMIKIMNIKKKNRDFYLTYAAINLVGMRNANGFILLYNDFVANNVFLYS